MDDTDSISDVTIPYISVEAARKFINEKRIEAEKMYTHYYRRESWYTCLYYTLQILGIGVGILGGVFGIADFQGTTKARIIGSVSAVIGGGLATVATIVNASKKAKTAERAGDDYKIFHDVVSMIDPDDIESQEVPKVVQWMANNLKKFTLKYKHVKVR